MAPWKKAEGVPGCGKRYAQTTNVTTSIMPAASRGCSGVTPLFVRPCASCSTAFSGVLRIQRFGDSSVPRGSRRRSYPDQNLYDAENSGNRRTTLVNARTAVRTAHALRWSFEWAALERHQQAEDGQGIVGTNQPVIIAISVSTMLAPTLHKVL